MGHQDLITASEAAIILGVSRVRIHQMIDEGKLPVVQMVGAQKIKLLSKAKVERFRKEREKG